MRIQVRVSRPQDDVRVRVSKRYDPRFEMADGRVGETRRFRRVKRISLNLCVPFVDTRGACWSKNAADPSPRALLRAIVAKNEGISFFTSLSFFLSFVRVP